MSKTVHCGEIFRAATDKNAASGRVETSKDPTSEGATCGWSLAIPQRARGAAYGRLRPRAGTRAEVNVRQIVT